MAHTYYGTCYNNSYIVTSAYQFWLEITIGSPSPVYNNTDVTIAAKLKTSPSNPIANSAYNMNGNVNFHLKIDGKTVYSTSSANVDTRNNQTWTFLEKEYTIAHNDDGTKAISVQAEFSGVSNQALNSGSVKVTNFHLPTIPRGTSLDSFTSANGYFDGVLTFKYTPKSTAWYNRAVITCGGTTIKTLNLGKKEASQQTQTVTLTESELSAIYNTVPNAQKENLELTLYTYSDSVYSSAVGDAVSKELELYIAQSTATLPNVSMSLAPTPSMSGAFSGLYIQGKSRVKATITATGKYGASITSRSMKTGGVTYGSSADYTSDYLQYGSQKVYGYATDSRGFTGSAEKTIEVIPYSKPQLKAATGESDVVASRCDSAGNLSDSGTYLKIKAKRSYAKVLSGGVQKNFCSVRYRYKLSSAASYSAWTTILASGASSDEVVTGALLSGALLATASYNVQVQAIDDLGEESVTTIDIPTDKVYMHRDSRRRSLALGKYIEQDGVLDVAEDITTKFRGDVEFLGEEWVSLGLSSAISAPTARYGRINGGCYYRVCAGNKHVYVAFNCSFSYTGSPVTVNATKIPASLCPQRAPFSVCWVSGRAIAKVYIETDGSVVVDFVQSIASGTLTGAYPVSWIDGYIDYFLD